MRSMGFTKQAGRRSFWDMGLFYRDGALEATANDVLDEWENQTVRVAVRTTVQFGANERVRLYIAHWRSRLTPNSDAHRTRAAQILRRTIERDLAADVPVVVLADFNLEPFDGALVETLASSRDPRLVLRHRREKLFNPTWSLAAPPSSDPWQAFGSISFKNTRWLFDQALTSSHFLDDVSRIAPTVAILPPPHSNTADHDLLELTLP